MVESTLTEIGRVTKKAVIGALKDTGAKAESITETSADLVKATIEGVGDFTAAIEKRVGDIVTGAVEAGDQMGTETSRALREAG